MTSQVRLTAPRAAKNGDAQLPEFLRDGWLVANKNGTDLWTSGKDGGLWLVPYPYEGRGERKITYDDAANWVEENLQRVGIRYLAGKAVFSGDKNCLTVRCPACGEVGKINGSLKSDTIECPVCKRVFPADKARR